jgi:metal-sulfur cluster biosynthetic enzyme
MSNHHQNETKPATTQTHRSNATHLQYRPPADVLRLVRDPEHPYTLSHLGVISEANVRVYALAHGTETDVIRVQFTPTVAHCSLAQVIGLCLRAKLREAFPECKVELVLTPGAHVSELEINRQINDKERVCAAMENEGIVRLVDSCTRDEW